jgi:hypothetical protein
MFGVGATGPGTGRARVGLAEMSNVTPGEETNPVLSRRLCGRAGANDGSFGASMSPLVDAIHSRAGWRIPGPFHIDFKESRG